MHGKKTRGFVKLVKRLTAVTLSMSMTFGGVNFNFETKSFMPSLAEAGTNSYGLQDNIQDGVILHCFNWKYNDIKAELPNIANAGFTSVQTSPAQQGVNSGTWYWLYQPLGFYIGNNDLGTKEELRALCAEADKYGIKVIVDIVANHLAGDHTNIQADLKDSQYWHNYSDTIDYYNRYEITHGNLGMADINTEHEYVMQCVNNYIAELKSVGVDGLRWDAAKHIGLPSEGSNFWPTVCGNNGLWNYGEILGGPTSHSSGYDHLMTEYTNYMSVTDSSYGSTLRNAFNSGTVPTTHANWTARAVATNKMVLWAETHDTWSNGKDAGYSNEMSQNVIDRAYAIAASREGSSALYFSRPSATEKNDIKAGVKGSTHFKSKEVAAINHFHNAMVGQKEYFAYGDNVAVVCREKGAVLALGTGSGYISAPNGGGTTAPGTYKDEITGNTFTVTDTTISGTVGETGIAVIYNYDTSITETTTVDTSNKAYIKLPSGWSAPIYCYAYNDSGTTNNSWPGVQMTYDSSTGYYVYQVPDTISNPKVIFYSSDTNRFPGDQEPGLSFTSNGSWIYADGEWKEYVKEVITTVAQTTTTTTTANIETGPEEVFGQVISSTNSGIIDVVWGNNGEGYLYNVYVDGNIATDLNGAKLQGVGCAAYQIPVPAGSYTVKITSVYNGTESEGVTGSVTVTGSAEETTTVSMDGYQIAGANWNDLDYWSVYFASGWAGEPTGGYKDGGSYSDFAVKINTASNAEWGIQMKTKALSVEFGAEYVCKVNVTSNMASTANIRIKDEISQSEKLQSLTVGDNTFELSFVAGDTAQIFFDLGLAPAGLEFEVTSFSLEKSMQETTVIETTAENITEEITTIPETTEEQTTEQTTVKTIEGGIEINGFQISSTSKGVRTIYSVDSEIDNKEVVESGVVYALSDYVDESDIYVGSDNEYVRSFASTSKGLAINEYTDSHLATSYVMTMKFGVMNSKEYSANWNVRGYALLSDGTYVYTDVAEYTIYEIADYVYQNCKMNTETAHDYLFTDILSVVNSDYVKKEFDWNNSLIEG